MDIVISPQSLNGQISAMPSKSHAHRVLICAALADAESKIELARLSDDMIVTMNCLRALGAEINWQQGICTVKPISDAPKDMPVIDCGESGSTLRFLLPIVAALGFPAHFIGSGRLPERPLQPLVDRLRDGGATLSSDHLPLTVNDQFTGNSITLPGNISSQYISGLLLAAPLCPKGLRIHLTAKLESAAYVDITIATMASFGVQVTYEENGFSVAAGARYQAPKDPIRIEGDWSNAAFFLAAGALSGRIDMSGLAFDSPQGDRAIVEILRAFGAIVAKVDDRLIVESAPLSGMSIDVSDIPDLVPILAVVASAAEGCTYFTNAGRLRIKESDRLATTAALINNLGGNAAIEGDDLIVQGYRPNGGIASSHNDHRIAMSAAILGATLAKEKVTIVGAQAVNKSYPDFFNDFKMLGGQCHELPIR